MVLTCDWQTATQKIAQRGQYLLETGQWSDCKFIVGQEPNHQIVEGHKVFLAMSSPVFEAMFYGALATKDDPIPIRDVQPEAFKALMEYIYTDRVDLGSFELACELCYCAKKYMLPFLVQECTKYLWSDLSPKKACRAYEFAKLFEEPVLMTKCLQIICSKTSEVLIEPSWEEVELETVLTLLDQEELQISSEIDLFNALERWGQAECKRKSLDIKDPKAVKSIIGNALTKIRFLTLTPKEFAESPGKSLLLTQQEAFSILMNISSTKSKEPMPEGFSTNTNRRTKSKVEQNSDSRVYQGYPTTLFGNQSISFVSNKNDFMRTKYYCTRSILNQSNIQNYGSMDCSVSFSADRNIFIFGVEVASQIINDLQPSLSSMTYTEVLYAHLLDGDGTRLTYTHYTTKTETKQLIEISFNQPVYIQKNKLYKIGVVFNQPGWYPLANCIQRVTNQNVTFTFNIGVHGIDYLRDGLIRSIIFNVQ